MADERRRCKLFVGGRDRSGTETKARTLGRDRRARRNFAAGPAVRPYHLSCHVLALRQKHRETFARAASFDEFAHRQFVAAIKTVTQRGHEFRRAFRQNDFALNDNGIARKMHRLFRQDIDQFGHMFADCALPVFIEGRGEPNGGPIWQRTKASVEMIEPRIDKLDRDNKTTKHVRNRPMRLNIGTKFVAAKERITAKERIAFAFEVEIIGQPGDFVTVFFHPAGKMRRFARALLVPEITWNEFATNRESRVGRENHVRKLWLRRD